MSYSFKETSLVVFFSFLSVGLWLIQRDSEREPPDSHELSRKKKVKR